MPEDAIGIRVLGVEDWPRWRELRLWALGEAAYAFSSKLADWQGEGDTESRWRDRLATVPFNLAAELNGRPAGMMSCTAPDERGAVELISMWVAPFARGRGVGDALVHAAMEWGCGRCASRMNLDVVQGNEHAALLYRRHGFRDAGSVGCEGCVSELRMTRELER